MRLRNQLFRILDDVDYSDRWHLDVPTTLENKPVDPWQFTSGRVLDSMPPLVIPIQYPGKVLDFTFAGFDIPVVTTEVQQAIQLVAPGDVQFFPVAIEGFEDGDVSFAILNVTHHVQCLDEKASEFTKWTAADRRPDKNGQYRMVTRLIVDPGRVSLDLFRIEGWLAPLIVGDAVRRVLEPFSGIAFQPV